MKKYPGTQNALSFSIYINKTKINKEDLTGKFKIER